MGRGGKPLSKNLGPWLSHLGLVLWVLPRLRNVDFAPTPLLSSGTVWVNGCKPLVGQISCLNAIAWVAELLLSVIHVTHACHVHEVTAVALHVQYSIFSISVTAIEQARPLVQAVTYRDAALAVT